MRHRGLAIALRLWCVAIVACALMFGAGAARAGGPQGELRWGVHVTLAPTWFDPAETPGLITPYMVMYAVHDAMAKPMPGQPLAPSLAQSWSASEDALTYEFVLRDGVKFHNGDPVTAEDVKFSFERYRGASAKLLHARVGAGPYKYVSFAPGDALVLEAFDGYWRKVPSVRRLVLRSIPDESTRLAALKRGEVDIVYSIRAELAAELERTKGLTLKPAVNIGMYWLYFPDQWDAKSPWHDQRVRLAAYLAIDRKTINQAITLGHSRITGSIVPDSLDFYWAPPPPTYDPARAKQLLAAAGYPNGFDAGDYHCDAAYADLGEAVLNNLQEVGIRAKLRPLEL